MHSMFSKKSDILLVEDEPGDIRLVTEVLKEGMVKHNVHVTRNGLEAINFLKKKDSYEEAPTPDLILLDLNMPIMNGIEFLKEVKQEPVLKKIPVCVLSTSSSDRDLDEAYNLHANCYITKPMELNAYRDVIRTIETFWLQIAGLPEKF